MLESVITYELCFTSQDSDPQHIDSARLSEEFHDHQSAIEELASNPPDHHEGK